MQILKDEIREKIISISLDEFLGEGFRGASMRVIAKKAGINVGNIYRYYENKQAIFAAIVEPAYQEFRSLIERTIDHEAEPVVGDLEFGGRLTERVLQFAYNYREPFILIFEKSSGTPYEHAKDELLRMMVEHFVGETRDKMEGLDFFIEIVFRNFLEGFSRIVQRSSDKAWVRDNVSRLIRYHIGGLKLFL